MERRLGRTARRIRQQHELGLLDIAHIAGVDQATLSRFEKGDGWRRDTNAIVAAYARATGLKSADIWRMALEGKEDA